LAQSSACSFCRLILGEEEVNIIYETDATTCFLDHDLITEGHTLIIPKAHIVNVLANTSSA